MQENKKSLKLKKLAFGTMPDGYFGDRAKVIFSFNAESGKTIAITDHGYFNSHLPCCIDAKEALYNLQGHHGKQAKIQLCKIYED